MEDALPVHVFGYLDHRKLLLDLFAAHKARGRGFSHRAFARRAGLSSTNYLKLVMDGKRNLSAEMAQRFAQGFGLERTQASFFCDLVAFNHAKSSAERARTYERLARYRRHREMRKLVGDQSRYYDHWYLPAIRELVRCSDFDEDPRWIARRLMPRITPARARVALATLLELGLLSRDDQGKLVQSELVVTAGTGPLGHRVASYHRAMLQNAADAIDSVAREEREISSITFCTSQQVMLELKQRLADFRAELLHLAEQSPAPERVVQVNFQLFPLSAQPTAAAAARPTKVIEPKRRRGKRS